MKTISKIKKITQNFGLFALFFAGSAATFAQTTSSDSLIVRPFQITFISPMGTN